MNREMLLFAKGGGDVKPLYCEMYHVSQASEVVIHSCERMFGGNNMMIRFKKFENR